MNNRTSAARRIVAAVVDLLFLWIGGSVGSYVAVSFFADHLEPWQAEAWQGIVMACFWLLYGSFEVITAASPGKMILGLRIANADGSKAPRSVLMLRWSTK